MGGLSCENGQSQKLLGADFNFFLRQTLKVLHKQHCQLLLQPQLTLHLHLKCSLSRADSKKKTWWKAEDATAKATSGQTLMFKRFHLLIPFAKCGQ